MKELLLLLNAVIKRCNFSLQNQTVYDQYLNSVKGSEHKSNYALPALALVIHDTGFI